MGDVVELVWRGIGIAARAGWHLIEWVFTSGPVSIDPSSSGGKRDRKAEAPEDRGRRVRVEEISQ
ncbi:hypothetical protein [Actinoplanes siamensis]|uniref:Uncharacterized protein n=1 Tax=Actinoplanes siamensis TaxID=1223317 RepID=A0A919N5K9_9ACTN|nr:hypothetical protein [Actinoplanes siamensis]GIF04737.1 hypothetical protein Asi03nite_22750 [Actinoplanes siamensis]